MPPSPWGPLGTLLVPAAAGAVVGAACTWWLAVFLDRSRAAREEADRFRSGLMEELKRCCDAAPDAPTDPLLNDLALANIVAYGNGLVPFADVPEAARPHVEQVFCYVDRLRRCLEAEPALPRDSCAPGTAPVVVRSAATAKLEQSLRACASAALRSIRHAGPRGGALRHARPIFWDKQFWTLVGVVALIVLAKVFSLNLSGSDDLAIAGSAAAFIVMDIQRDIAHSKGRTTARARPRYRH